MVWNKHWEIRSRSFKIKNKILCYDLIIFQCSWSHCLEFILNYKNVKYSSINPFQASVPLIYPREVIRKLWFSDKSGETEMEH